MRLSILPVTLPWSGDARSNTSCGVDAARDSILPLALEGVSYCRDGQVLLHQLSLSLTAGATTVVLGPNGAGKSLLLRICHGLIPPSSGHVRWQGPQAARAVARQAMVFQRPVMLRRSAAANVEYSLRLLGVPRAERREQAHEALRMAGLERLADRNARVLSGGEQQRLALARAWARNPEVLFLDEPTANLDPAATRAVETVIGVFRASGCKIVMSTHDLGQARRLADEVLLLHRGQLIERSISPEFFRQPRTSEGRAYLSGNLLW